MNSSFAQKGCSNKVSLTQKQNIPKQFSPEDQEVRRWYRQGYVRLRRLACRDELGLPGRSIILNTMSCDEQLKEAQKRFRV